MPSNQPEASFVVEVDDNEVRCTRPNGDIERVQWSDLKGVIIKTTDEGPLLPDVFLVLVGSQGGCVIPQGAIGEDKLMDRLQKLPGFDNEAVIAAMTYTGNKEFLCWKKDG